MEKTVKSYKKYEFYQKVHYLAVENIPIFGKNIAVFFVGFIEKGLANADDVWYVIWYRQTVKWCTF